MKNTTDTRKYGASFICKYSFDCELRHCAADRGFKNDIVPTSTIVIHQFLMQLSARQYLIL